MFGKQAHQNDFVLVIYDTKAVTEIDARDRFGDYDKQYPPLAAKYALLVGDHVEGDSHLFAQGLRHINYRDRAVWFDTWANIDAAMTELRRRNPERKLIDKIGYIIDWPWGERTDDPIHLKVGDYRYRHPEWRMVAIRNE